MLAVIIQSGDTDNYTVTAILIRIWQRNLGCQCLLYQCIEYSVFDRVFGIFDYFVVYL